MTKLGIAYNIFDDSIELLEKSILSVRNVADYITVIYQDISNMGNQSEINLKELLTEYKDKGLINSFYIYKPQLNVPIPHINEMNKRNMGLYVCQGEGCTHFMSMDSDEFYKEDELNKVLDVMVEGNYDSSACQLQTYWKSGEWVLDPPEDYYVSLFYKVQPNVEFIMGYNFPVLVDPTRRMKPGNCKIFTRDEIEMHHMSYVRKDISKKLYNSSAVHNFSDKLDFLCGYFNNWKEGDRALLAGVEERYYNLNKVDNIFNVNE
jgi:hypothetical protein